MKRGVVVLLGVLIGAAAAAALLYFNPLTAGRAPAAAAGELTLAYSYPFTADGIYTHGPWMPGARVPEGVPELWEEAVSSTVLAARSLRDPERDIVAAASRISVPSTRTNMVLNGLVVADHWLVSIPGVGSMFVVADTNLWPPLRDTFVAVDLLRRPWSGATVHMPTLGPLPGRAARVLGASGELLGRTGSARETVEIRRYSAAAGLEALDGRLDISFDGDPPGAD